jgi:glycosyltransferase involved in cell wall biosynthesis
MMLASRANRALSVAVNILPGVQSGFDRWQRETVKSLEHAFHGGKIARLGAFSFGKRYARPDWLPAAANYRTNILPGRLQQFLCSKLGLRVESVCRTGPADVVLSLVLEPLRTRAPFVLAVADVSWRFFSGQYRTTFTNVQVEMAESAIRQADHILTLSQASADDLASGGFPADRITVAPLGVADEFWEVPAEAGERVRARYGLPAEFVLYIGGVNERKNVTVLAAALNRLSPRPPLVIAGVPPTEGLAYWGLDQGNIHHLGYIPGPDLPGLYRAATMLVFPSKLEGFGLPLVEAAAVGLPILAAETRIFREVGGDAILFFNPDSPEHLAELISRLLSEPTTRAAMAGKAQEHARHYTHDRYQAAVIKALARAADESNANHNGPQEPRKPLCSSSM